AAEAAARADHLHIAGLAHELAARLLRAAGDASAAHHVQEATRYYQQWGATAPITRLDARIAAYALASVDPTVRSRRASARLCSSDSWLTLSTSSGQPRTHIVAVAPASYTGTGFSHPIGWSRAVAGLD